MRAELRSYLFETLIPTAESTWPGDEADLFDAGLDSLRLMQLLVFVEDAIKVVLPDHEVTPERVGSINSLLQWIESHKSD